MPWSVIVGVVASVHYGYSATRPERACELDSVSGMYQANMGSYKPYQPHFCASCGAPPEKHDSACSYCKTRYQ